MLSLSVGRSKRWQNWFWPEHCVKKEYCSQISPFGMGVSSGYCIQAFLWPLISNMSWWHSDQLLLLINLARWHIPHPGMIFGSGWKFSFWLQWMWAEYFEKGLQNQVARTLFRAAEETRQQQHLRWVLILWQCPKGNSIPATVLQWRWIMKGLWFVEEQRAVSHENNNFFFFRDTCSHSGKFTLKPKRGIDTLLLFGHQQYHNSETVENIYMIIVFKVTKETSVWNSFSRQKEPSFFFSVY